MSKSIKAFCITERKGYKLIRTIRWWRKDAILVFLSEYKFDTWKEARKYGWRCIKVMVTDI